MGKTIEYYFAPQSPFAYLGHTRLVALAQQHGAQIDLRPCDLGRVFSVSGGLALAKRSPQRQAYRLLELQRWQAFTGLPLNLQPTFFPVSGDAAARLIIAVRLAHGSEVALALTGAIMAAVWADEKNIADADTLIALVNALELELDGAALMKSAETPSVQAEYEHFTDAAIAASVFGAPWYVVDGQGYWGQDRLDFVERALQQ
jgi:2-hydroxychromene-2-carboxylate isomerase